jgi:hypothetical protein
MLLGMRLLVLLLLTPLLLPAAQVRIEKTADGFQLLRDGKPYFVYGASGSSHLQELVRSGGNSTRTSPQKLNEAQQLGLTALVGLPLGKQRSGFDYGDAAAVEKQRQQIRDIVTKYKDHPAVLMWGIGNEPEIHTTGEQRRQLWKEVDHLARMIRDIDPNHPVITIVGGEYRQILHEIAEQCPNLDAIGLNAYQDMLTMPEDVAREGWKKAYIVTEFGPVGHWQAPKTPWRIPIEATSTEKAEFYEKAYRHAVLGQPNCLGSYVFYWDQKMEKTHTWYGLFLEDGSRTNALDAMTLLWSGKQPANRCPRVSRIRVGGSADPARVAPGATVKAELTASDPDGDTLDIRWDLRPDVADNPEVGGDYEDPVGPIPGAILDSTGGHARVKIPAKPGNYRLFVYVRDGNGNAATANLPLRAE